MQCDTCKYYESYRDAYFGDELEPDDQGFCRGNPENDGWTAGECDACGYYEERRYYENKKHSAPQSTL